MQANPVAPGKRTIGLKPTSRGAAGVATVTRITFREDEEGPPEASVEVRYGPKPKKNKDGMTIGRYPDTSDLRLPAAVARKLSVGMKCRITLEPVGTGGYDDEKAEGE